MSNAFEKKVDEALREYLEAVDEHHKLLYRYFPVRPVVPGKPIVPGEPITEAALKEIEEAGDRVSKTQKNWMGWLEYSGTS